MPRHLPPPKPDYKDSKGGSGFGPYAYLRAWNRCDEYPRTSGKQAILERRYRAARLSVAPTLFSKSNPPPKGAIPIVDRKKAMKLKKQRIRSRKALKKARRRIEKRAKRQKPIPL